MFGIWQRKLKKWEDVKKKFIFGQSYMEFAVVIKMMDTQLTYQKFAKDDWTAKCTEHFSFLEKKFEKPYGVGLASPPPLFTSEG